MKFIDTLRLSSRNLLNNFMHSALAFAIITILSVLVMSIANFCWMFNVNCNANTLALINQEGARIQIGTPSGDMAIDQSYIDDFINLAAEKNIDDYCSIDRVSNYKGIISIQGEYVECMPYFGRYELQNEFYRPLAGDPWTIEDEGKDHIWLSQQMIDKFHLNIGDKVPLVIGNAQDAKEFVIKGITDYYSFIDINYFDINCLVIGMKSSNYTDMKEIYALEKAVDNYTNSHVGINVITNLKSDMGPESGFINMLCVILIILSIGVSITCVLNTLKISIENNNASLGMMKALGAKNRNLIAYILLQIGMIVLASTVVATLITCLIGYLAMGAPIKVLMGIMFSRLSSAIATASFWFVLPLINIVLVGGVVAISSISMLRRYTNLDAIKIINEGNV